MPCLEVEASIKLPPYSVIAPNMRMAVQAPAKEREAFAHHCTVFVAASLIDPHVPALLHA